MDNLKEELVWPLGIVDKNLLSKSKQKQVFLNLGLIQ